MKKILLLGIGGLLALVALVVNILSAVRTMDKINASNFLMCLVAFILDFITTPAGLLGVILIVIGLKLKNGKAKT